MDNRIYLNRLSSVANLPGASLPGSPVVEIFGDRRVLIERHQGVISYDHNTIRVKVRNGQLCVSGYDMVIAQMTKIQLVVLGKIRAVVILQEDRCGK